jgi:DNA-binding IclR family transcriptional regulator
LLAHLPGDQLDRYLAQDVFVALTPATITDPAELGRHLALVRQRGWATDRGEIAPDLSCLAVPLLDAAGETCAAISVSVLGEDGELGEDSSLLPQLRDVAHAIRMKLFPQILLK